MKRLFLMACVTVGVIFLAEHAAAVGPCVDAIGCAPSGAGCLLVACSCDELGGSCVCGYYCDTDRDQKYDQRCTSDPGNQNQVCEDISQRDSPSIADE